MNKKLKKYLKGVYRWIQPFFEPVTFILSFPRYIMFFRDWHSYSRMQGAEQIALKNIYPRLHEKTQVTIFDKHYFYQDTWAFHKILATKPNVHVDVGSSVMYAGFLSAVTRVQFVDIRPIESGLNNIESIKGDALSLPFKDNSVASLSCLSVAEHIGLGRYGDKLDPYGTKKACRELSRVLARGGNLFFALPVGKPAVFFNAHRIHAPQQIMDYFSELKLVEFSAVLDKGEFMPNANKDILATADFSCGLFWFRKA